MECRNCGRQIPDDSEICLLCGTRQSPYILNMIEAKNAENDSGKPMRGVLSVLIMVVVVAALIFIFVPAAEESGRIGKLEEVNRAADEKDLDEFILKASQYYARYGGSEDMGVVLKRADELGLKFDPADGPSLPVPVPEAPVSPGDEANTLMESAGSEIIEVRNLDIEVLNDGEVRCKASWLNRSKKTVTDAVFVMELYDGQGKPVKCLRRGDSKAAATVRGLYTSSDRAQIYASDWVGMWYNKDAASVKIVEIRLKYLDGSTVILPEAVAETVAPKR